MKHISRLLAAYSLATLAHAQCFETNFGTNIGRGDDSLLPSTGVIATGLTGGFPFGGTTYNDIRVSTNGFLYLSNANVPAAGSASLYSSAAATLSTNLRTGSPKIAVFLRDLNLTVANVGDVFVNNSFGNRCVITWRNYVEFSNVLPTRTAQLQIFNNGDILYYFSGNTAVVASGARALVGCSPGGGAADPLESDLSTGFSTTVPTVYQTFTQSPSNFDLAGLSVLFAASGTGYNVSSSPCVPAAHTSYGAGCRIAGASAYELFALPASFDLNGRNLEFNETGTGWTVSLSTGPSAPVSPTAFVLSDDSEVTQALTTPFAASVNVCSNGFISVGGSNGTSFTPATTFVNDTFETWRVWHDMNPGIVGSGQVTYENIGGVGGEDVFTWNGVWDFSGTSATNANTFQISLSGSPGSRKVRICITQMSGLGNGVLVGYSPAGANIDPGSTDISATTLPFSLPALDVSALALNATPPPVLGASVTYTVSNIRPTLSVSGILFSFFNTAPTPLSTFALDAPNCFAHIDVVNSLMFGSLLFLNPTDSFAVSMPTDPSWLGANLYFQAVELSPSDNPAGVITSNGLRSTLNSF